MRATLTLILVLCGRSLADKDWRVEGDRAFAQQEWEAAVNAYRIVVGEHADDARAWFRLGFALHAARHIDEAIEAHRRAAAFPETRLHALYNLACAFGLKGDSKAAVATLAEAMAAGFVSRSDIASDPDFASISGDAAFRRLAREGSLYRQFDFWVGRWEVFDPKGQQVGSSVIALGEKGKVITENWTNMKGQTGTSMNFIDPVDGKWHQIWVDPGGTVIRYAGSWSNGAMVFTGISTDARGRSQASRMTFTPIGDGTVRQVIARSSDNGATWTPEFDGLYRPEGAR